MLNNFLEEVVVSVIGKPGENLAGLLNSKKHVNEFIIAKKMDITINQVRNYLYKLSDFGVVSSIRKKDKKKGWYTYFWRIEISKALEFLKQTLSLREEELKELIKNRQLKQFYQCERCNLEFDEDVALLMDFTCNECGGIFTIKDNSKFIKDLTKKVELLVEEKVLVDKEIEKENQKLEKEKEKVQKKIDKENEAKKLEKKLAREKLKKEKNSSKEKVAVAKKISKVSSVKESKKESLENKIAKKKVAIKKK